MKQNMKNKKIQNEMTWISYQSVLAWRHSHQLQLLEIEYQVSPICIYLDGFVSEKAFFDIRNM